MAKITKRLKAAQAAVQPGKLYGLEEALNIVKNNAKAKFAESVKVAVFVPAGEKAEAAKAAGADAVGMDDLAERMQAGDLDFGRVIATPDAMRVVGKLGQLLGPRGLM